MFLGFYDFKEGKRPETGTPGHLGAKNRYILDKTSEKHNTRYTVVAAARKSIKLGFQVVVFVVKTTDFRR